MSRRLIVPGAMALAGLLGLVFSTPALAKQRNRMVLTAPATNTAGEGFVIHISGFVVAPVNTFTEYLSRAGCPAAFHSANSVGNQGGSEQLHPGKHGRRFSIAFEPTMATPGLYHICAYLIYRNKTYARATGQSDSLPL